MNGSVAFSHLRSRTIEQPFIAARSVNLQALIFTYSRVVVQVVDWVVLLGRSNHELVDDEGGGVAVPGAHRDLQLDVGSDRGEISKVA